MDYEAIFAGAVKRLRDERRYRIFTELGRQAGAFPRALNHSEEGAPEVTVWCSNDYLGMGQHPAVLAAMTEAVVDLFADCLILLINDMIRAINISTMPMATIRSTMVKPRCAVRTCRPHRILG